MYSYIEGIITEIESSFITLENNKIGYQIYTPNPYKFNINETYKIYIYQLVKEDEISLYGFKEKKEKELFLKLINVKGLGCKMALPILATGSIDGIIDAIERENILYLKKFPKIGEKVAKQIILDLKGKLTKEIDITENIDNTELVETLKALGYKNQDINRILPNINKGNALELQVKEALRLLLK
ncbi:MAG: Holliday junction branch migration protein RuvA [Bacilli bacterium]|nr:Holliday junction branch migration protein RuvA [Bacilli bacterium]